MIPEDADPHADRLDPGPRPLEPVAGHVGERRAERGPTEPDDELALRRIADLDPGGLRPDAEGQAERWGRSAADPDREALDRHADSVLAAGRIGRPAFPRNCQY